MVTTCDQILVYRHVLIPVQQTSGHVVIVQSIDDVEDVVDRSSCDRVSDTGVWFMHVYKQ